MTKNAPHPPLVITLTLPHSDHLQKEGTLLIARGDLAHLRQVTYTAPADLLRAMETAVEALIQIEAVPPVILDTPAVSQSSVPPPTEVAGVPSSVESEPMLVLPLKKGSRRVKQSCLVLPDGSDETIHQQAINIAGRLLDAKLWDGVLPLSLPDGETVWRKLRQLDDKTLAALYTLEDFVSVGVGEPPADHDDEEPAPAFA